MNNYSNTHLSLSRLRRTYCEFYTTTCDDDAFGKEERCTNGDKRGSGIITKLMGNRGGWSNAQVEYDNEGRDTKGGRGGGVWQKMFERTGAFD